ncbi:MAG: single-stranded-DNA-specific exonuclease RecJ [Dialister sp.]|nr:single-stranded-DNA-specific exonuclease RecJ [Dialister sp.]
MDGFGMANYKWHFPDDAAREIPDFFSRAGIPAGIAHILIRRGIATEESLFHFLYDTVSDLADPFLMKGMEAAVSRIYSALENHEKIVIYGDYDVDGITSTSILVRYFRSIGANVSYYIPAREKEGYGLNAKAIEKLAGEGFTLLITVDCGISSAQLIDAAPDSLSIIVTDHHEPPEVLPKRAVAVINPHQKDCAYPYKELAGCGVAFTLCRALEQSVSSDVYDTDIELVALGTIADVVSLTGENRILVREGLKRLNHTKNIGLKALLVEAGLVPEEDADERDIRAEQVSFGLAPRINAAGRIAYAGIGVELLTTNTETQAEELARRLCEANVERQRIERDIYDQALLRIEELKLSDKMALVVDGTDWHPGVIGIVASRILEMYHRPVCILTVKDGMAKGSCRSIPAFNIYEALAENASWLTQFGGHKMAAGFSLPAENIDDFRGHMESYAKAHLTVEDCVPILDIEESLPLTDMTLDFVNALDSLEPYGSDNPKPLFFSENVFVENTRRIGQDRRHFKCAVSSGNDKLDLIFWRAGDTDPCRAGETVDIVYEPKIHDWYGKHVQLIGKDIAPHGKELLNRDVLVDIFVVLRNAMEDSLPENELKDVIHQNTSGIYASGLIDISLQVFQELGILESCTDGGTTVMRRKIVHDKLDLNASPTYRKYLCGVEP